MSVRSDDAKSADPRLSVPVIFPPDSIPKGPRTEREVQTLVSGVVS